MPGGTSLPDKGWLLSAPRDHAEGSISYFEHEGSRSYHKQAHVIVVAADAERDGEEVARIEHVSGQLRLCFWSSTEGPFQEEDEMGTYYVIHHDRCIAMQPVIR
jgi:hypothetical protein